MAQDNLSNNELDESLGKEDIIDILAEDDKEVDKIIPPEKEEKEKKDKEEIEPEGEDKEEKEPELELDEEEGETEPEIDEFIVPPNRKEILKAYPDLFKKFPYLEKAFYRDQQFTERFPTPDDADVAIEKSKILDNFEQQLVGGNITGVLNGVKRESEEGFVRLVDNYLPALQRVDREAYYHVVGNVVKNTIASMVNEANRLGDNGKPLEAAALLLNQFVFGTSEFKPPTRLGSNEEKENSESERIRQERTQIIKEKFEDTQSDLDSKVANVLKATIGNNIDPKHSMTDYVRRTAAREAFETLESQIAKDTRFRSYLDKLWEKAFETRFSRQSVDNIRKAYLSKAKTLLPSILQKSRNDALRGLGKRVKEESEEETTRKGPIAGSRQASSTTSNRGKENPSKGMKTLDYLMQD